MAIEAKERYALIRRYANGPTLRRAFARVPSPALKWRPAPGEWSAHEVVCHCADSETNSYARIRYLIAEPTPVIQGYDQDRWAISLDYHHHPVASALATVAAVRANTTALIRRLPEDAWARKGTHTESGPYSAEEWLRIYAEHLEIHARQDRRRRRRMAQGTSEGCGTQLSPRTPITSPEKWIDEKPIRLKQMWRPFDESQIPENQPQNGQGASA